LAAEPYVRWGKLRTERIWVKSTTAFGTL
jgi:hypothetical protein